MLVNENHFEHEKIMNENNDDTYAVQQCCSFEGSDTANIHLGSMGQSQMRSTFVTQMAIYDRFAYVHFPFF